MLLDLAGRIPCRRLIDIGCDHAWVPLELLKNGHCQSILVTDLRQGPLQAAMRRAEGEGVVQGFETCLTDGLDRLDVREDDLLLISGLGGETIAGILEAHPQKARRPVRLILQPQTKEECLREALVRLGLSIREEHYVLEGDKVYLVILAEAGGPVSETLRPLELFLGPRILLRTREGLAAREWDRDPALEAYLQKRLQRLKKQAPYDKASQAILDEFQEFLETP